MTIIITVLCAYRLQIIMQCLGEASAAKVRCCCHQRCDLPWQIAGKDVVFRFLFDFDFFITAQRRKVAMIMQGRITFHLVRDKLRFADAMNEENQS